ncbi:MAG: asparagine synthase (glutamine-hydrolyzing) [Lachnospiraceae bacterium]|nr:asparagine synthase (glutamine-hydrolyzing) [Lachnospiraceae bacterium]
MAGFCDHRAAYKKNPGKWVSILQEMNRAQKRRGPDEDGIYLSDHCGMAHVRLSIIDLERGQQPMTREMWRNDAKEVRAEQPGTQIVRPEQTNMQAGAEQKGTQIDIEQSSKSPFSGQNSMVLCNGNSCTVVFNGEIYNMPELRKELLSQGVRFESDSDTEVILQGYLRYGEAFVTRLNGIFAIALWDSYRETLFLFRDRAGVKPLFYRKWDDTLIYASEIKGIFAYPGIEPVVDCDSLCEIFALGPAKTYGKGVFKDIYEVLPGHYLAFQNGILTEHCYWELESHPHEDSFAETVEKTAWLVEDSVKMQMLSDIPISTFLSGGVDSSLVTAICARELRKQGKILNTFSFDFEGNQKYFRANAFQPSQDRPWVEKMVEFSQTRHRFLECDHMELFQYLYHAVDARDLPCMADVESSMLYFCSQVVKYNKVTLTGECADEIFGGYPWFHKKEAFETQAFPWSADMKVRQTLLAEEWIHLLPMEEYARAAYERTIRETPALPGEDAEEKRRREIAYLNLKWFMATLLDRMDRASMYSGLEARVPLADHRIIEYVWNVPWSMKCRDGVVKGLLRHAGAGKLPDEVLWRKKSPYPKTYHPAYEKMLGEQLKEVLADAQAPVRQFLDRKKVQHFLDSPLDYGKPWYGQLMAGPQMLAFMLQVNYWMKKYRPRMMV